MNDAAGSHLPILCKAFEHSDGPILEMGTGYWSTPILDMLCKLRKKRHILSLENDPEYYEINKAKYQSSYHDVKLINDWDNAPIDDNFWGLVLIDHRPALRRKTDIVRLRLKAYYILAHDSEQEINQFYRYDRVYKHFKYRYEFKDCPPETTIFSNFSDLKELHWH